MKRFISFALSLALMLTLLPTSFAASNEATEAAQTLYELGLFSGTGNNSDGTPNFDLDRAPTRQESITMLVRLLGKEEEAKAGTWDIPFTDVDNWAKPYVGYAYANGLTIGTGATTFGSNDIVTASQYLTFVLRALGYESGTDFQWDKPWTLSDQISLTSRQYNANTTNFTRGDVAVISNRALSTTLSGSDKKLGEAFNNNILFDGTLTTAAPTSPQTEERKNELQKAPKDTFSIDLPQLPISVATRDYSIIRINEITYKSKANSNGTITANIYISGEKTWQNPEESDQIEVRFALIEKESGQVAVEHKRYFRASANSSISNVDICAASSDARELKNTTYSLEIYEVIENSGDISNSASDIPSGIRYYSGTSIPTFPSVISCYGTRTPGEVSRKYGVVDVDQYEYSSARSSEIDLYKETLQTVFNFTLHESIKNFFYAPNGDMVMITFVEASPTYLLITVDTPPRN